MRSNPLWAAALVASALYSQTPSQPAADPWQALGFLEGTWEAQTPGGASGPAVSGTYVFRKELNGHILARHSSNDNCKGPVNFDCDHHDLLYIYQESAAEPLKAVYFDNEGHVIHYNVSTPSPSSVIFVSEPSGPGPHFRLIYELKGSSMSGKFQTQMPGQIAWKSYLEWSGSKK